MKANKGYYLGVRSLFVKLGLNEQVRRLDIHFEVNFLLDKHGNCIKIL